MSEQKSQIQEFSVQMGMPQSIAQPTEKGATTPFRLLWVSDLAPHLTRTTQFDAGSHILSVDKYNFPDLFERLHPQLTLEVPNHLSKVAKTFTVELSFNHLPNFSPEGVIAQIPALSQWVGVRDAVSEVKRKILSPEQFADQLKSLGVEQERADELYKKVKGVEKLDEKLDTASSSSGQSSGLDGLLGMVDFSAPSSAPPPPPPASEDPLDALIRALGAAGAGSSSTSKPAPVNKSATEELLNELDGMINTQLNVILHHPKFQALEAAWRNLKLLVDRLDFRKSVRLEVLCANKDQVNEALHYQVVMPCYNTPPLVPFAAVLVDFVYGDEPRDLERLSDMCDAGASLQTPIVASAAQKIWATRDSSGKLRYTNLQQQLEGSEFLGWSALRKGDSAQFVTLALPYFLLRALYRTEKSDSFAFQERVDTDGSGYLWGNASSLIGLAMSKSYVETGWASRFVGIGSHGVIEDLPTWRTNADMLTPLMVFADTTKQAEAPLAGFAVLASRANADSVYVAGAQSVKKPLDYIDPVALAEAQLHATLPCQMVTSKIANALVHWQTSMTSGMSKEQIETALVKTLKNVLTEGNHALSEDTYKIEIETSPRSEEHWGVGVWINAPQSILGETVSMALGFEVAK